MKTERWWFEQMLQQIVNIEPLCRCRLALEEVKSDPQIIGIRFSL